MAANNAGLRYQSPAKMARVLRWLLIVYVALSTVLLVLCGVWIFLLFAAAQAGQPPGVEPLTVLGMYGVIMFLSMIVTGVLCAGVVFWFLWAYRVRMNLIALCVPDLRFNPGWAVAWFFVPGMNLFRPWQVMKETVRASQPVETGADHLAWKTARYSPLVHW